MKVPARLGLELASYVLLALAAVSGALLRPGVVVGDGVDLYGTVWFFWWIRDCVERLTDPSFTTVMFHPLGKNIFAHTGDNFVDALLSVPFQWVFGHLYYQPIFIAVVLVGNALAMRALLRQLLGPDRPLSIWLGAALWQTAPFALFELICGRLTQAFLWPVPLALLFFLRLDERPLWRAAGGLDRRQVGESLLAGLLVGLVGWTYWFLGYFLGLLLLYLAADRLLRGPRSGALIAKWALAAGATALVIAPAALAMAKAGSSVPGLVEGGSIFEPPPALANNVSASLHGLVALERFGQPMATNPLWALALGAVLLLGGAARRTWGGAALLSLVVAVGPVVPSPTPGEPWVLPWYMAAYHHLPWFDRLWFPYRMVVIAQLATVVGLATLLAARWEARATRSRWALLLPIGLLGWNLYENHRYLAFPLVSRDLRPPAAYDWLREVGGGLIEMPIGLARTSIAFQPVHQQVTFGGMAENATLFWPAGMKRRMNNSLIRHLRQLTRDPFDPFPVKATDQASLVGEGFSWVVLDRQMVDADLHNWPWFPNASAAQRDQAPFLVQAGVSAVLGEPVAVDGPLVIWSLVADPAVPPAPLRPTPATLQTRDWALDTMPAYERLYREQGRFEGEPAPPP
jgi:hypothetical protein